MTPVQRSCNHITTRGWWCTRKATVQVGEHWYCKQHARHPEAGRSYGPVDPAKRRGQA